MEHRTLCFAGAWASFGMGVVASEQSTRAQVVSDALYTSRARCHQTDPNARCDAIDLLVPAQCACDYTRNATINGTPVVLQSVGRALTSGGTVPMADAQASLSAAGVTTVSAVITYGAYVFARTPSAVGREVPLLVRVRGHATASSSGRANDSVTSGAEAYMCIDFPQPCVRWNVVAACPAGQACSGPQSFDVSGLLFVRVQEFGGSVTGRVLATVTLTAGAFPDESPTGRVEGEAVADPEVDIDPAYPFRDDYYIVQSRNLFCPADVDDGSGLGVSDGGVTVDDLLYYLEVYTLGSLVADLDDGSGTGTRDFGVTIDDLLYFLVRYAAGC